MLTHNASRELRSQEPLREKKSFMSDHRWIFYPPPGASFQQTKDGLQVTFQKGREKLVEDWFRHMVLAWESVAHHKAMFGQHGETWPSWPANKDLPLVPPQGVTAWQLRFPSYCTFHMHTLTDMYGRIPIGVFGGIPGSVDVKFPEGKGEEVAQTLIAALDKATGRSVADFLASLVRKRELAPPPVTAKRAARHFVSPDGIPHVAPPSPIEVAGARVRSQAKALGDDFFASVGVEPPSGETESMRAVVDQAMTAMAKEALVVPAPIRRNPLVVALDDPEMARQAVAQWRVLTDEERTELPAELREALSLLASRSDTELPPPLSTAAPEVPTPPPAAVPPAPMPALPVCTCSSTALAMGGHEEGCPAENIPPGMLR
jgi:hypothetical protein